MPSSTGMTTANFVAYVIFMVLLLPVIYVRPHKLQRFFYTSAATILVFEVDTLIWSLATKGEAGFGDTMSNTNDHVSGWKIAFGIVSAIGSIAAGILSQNDYARFARLYGVRYPVQRYRNPRVQICRFSQICVRGQRDFLGLEFYYYYYYFNVDVKSIGVLCTRHSFSRLVIIIIFHEDKRWSD